LFEEILNAELEAENILNNIMPTIEQGVENHFRRNAPSCSRMEWDRHSMTAYAKIPGKEEVLVYATSSHYQFNEDASQERMQLEILHQTAEYAGMLCLKYLAQTLVDESEHRGEIDCYFERLSFGYHFLGERSVPIYASITEPNVLNQLSFQKNQHLLKHIVS
jgi:hypothetical protein